MKRNSDNQQVNSSVIMRLIALTIMLAFITPVMTIAQAGKANFSGNWTMNAAKSTMPQGGGQGGGGGARGGGGDFTITQDANSLSQSRAGQDGTARVTKYTLDGKETVTTSQRGDSKSTAKWSADGKSLTIVTKSTFNDTERTSTAVWSLVDAKTLSIVSTRQGQNGEVKTTMIYDKK